VLPFTVRPRISGQVTPEGVFAAVNASFQATPYLRGKIYDTPSYRRDFVDLRGVVDNYGGEEYTRFENTLGADVDWLMAKDKSLALSIRRVDVIPQEDAFTNSEYTAYQESVAYEQQVTREIMAGVRAWYAQTMYPSSDRGDTFGQNYTAYTAMQLTERSKLGASVGYSRYSDSDAQGVTNGETSSATVIGSIDLTTELAKDLSHSIGYSRSQANDFSSGVDVTDNFRYSIRCNGVLWSALLSTALNTVNPNLTTLPGYTDWVNYLGLSYRLTRYVVLSADTTYSVRNNEAVSPEDVNPDDPLENADYTTWVSRVGTSFLLTKSVSLTTYFEHAQRDSDAPDVPYERDTFELVLNYTHAF
jgi:hypothetical protein